MTDAGGLIRGIGKKPEPARRPRWRAALSWALRAAAVLALAVAGGVLGLRLARAETTETALGVISVRVDPAWHGEVDAFIPVADWGVRADVFSAPLAIHVEPRSVDREALIRAASGDRAVLRAAEQDARSAAQRALIRALLWAVAGALALGVVAALAARALTESSSRFAIAGWLTAPPVCAALFSLAIFLRAQDTFAPTAFDSPTFYARGAELVQLLNVAESAQETGDRYSSSVKRALIGYATLLNGGGGLERPDRAPPSLEVSDLHGNTLVLGPLERLVSGRPVFFVGDFGQSGTRAEADALIPQVERLGKRIVAVSGNHDSSLFMRRLAAAGITVLTDQGRLRADGSVQGPPTRRIAGVRVAGYPDPLEWNGDDPSDPDRGYSFGDLPNGAQRYDDAQRRLRRWFQRLRPHPDVVLIHQNGLAQALARTARARDPDRPLLILTGHDHEQHIDRYGDVLVVDAGTAGAGGAFGAGSESVGVAELHTPPGEVLPRAVDLIQVEPVSGAASAERVIVSSPEACERERVRCHRGAR